ncbi:MAG: serine/threonine-protein kinase [Candidatus Onthomorpha sp.]|nr:serine/threonine protein kinase [Bacteroidales bacterium]MDD7590814.1 serine/threonine-protein kinase [Bacteroidales bacterium]MDY5825660.1 serine/threonine-protein kinase [Candidatus Onthomorpha sp.]
MEETQHIESDSSALKASTGITLCNGKYELLKFLGKGGFGITYLGRHILLNKYVAIKEYFPKDNFRRESNGTQVSYSDESVARRNIEKFLKEAKTMAELNHEGVVKVNDVFEENNTAYYVMEYMEGKSLAEQLPIAQEQALCYIKQAAEALQYVHTKGILHLDIKPANIMINQSGKAVLIDFGISKHYDSEGKGTSSSTQGYSSGYSPIEQMTPGGLKQFTPPTDIYALGATLYEIVSGTTPPASTDLADEETLSRPENMSREVFGFVNKCMQQKRKDRPQTMSEVLGLIEALSGEKPKPKPTPKPKPEPKPRLIIEPEPDTNPKRRIIRIIAMVVVLLILVAVVVILAKDCSGVRESETATETLTETATAMPRAETLSKQLQEDNAKQQAEEQARQKKLQQEEQARLQAERQKKQQEEQRQQAERQKKQQQEREANFKSYKSRGDFYFNEYFDTEDPQAKQKAKQNYAKALQYKEDATVRKRYNSL